MTRTVLVTGARGFVGRNLVIRLRQDPGLRVLEYSRESTEADLAALAGEADVIVHLAAVNRSEKPADFQSGNVGVTERLVAALRTANNRPHVIFTSSIQAVLDNPYGRSKRAAEEVLERWAKETGATVTVMRIRNVFGKWCRPNYNSVVATFCHNIARGLPVRIDDPANEMELVHVDDVVDALIAVMSASGSSAGTADPADRIPSRRITVGELAERLYSFQQRAETLLVPDMSERFDRQLYGTYISYLEAPQWEYLLQKREDSRGDLAEFIKGRSFGQIFVSRTRPGITRGNHYHHTKVEKFLVIAGSAVIRFRHVEGGAVLEIPVRGEEYRVVEIPPGYTHDITNVGDTEMITLFWASEVFDSAVPDTIVLPVENPVGAVP